VSERKPCKADLTDEQWSLVGPVITAWKAAQASVSGHQGRYAMGEIVNALLYQGRTGCQWDLLPHDFPPPGAVKDYFCTWRGDGTDQTIHGLLRWQVWEKVRRKADPGVVVLDTQSVHAAAGVPAQSTGRDAAKKVPGRKRGLAVDVLGLVIVVVVVAASAHENAVGITLLVQLVADTDAGSPARRCWSCPSRSRRRRRPRSCRTIRPASRSWRCSPWPTPRCGRGRRARRWTWRSHPATSTTPA
jgi:transposase